MDRCEWQNDDDELSRIDSAFLGFTFSRIDYRGVINTCIRDELRERKEGRKEGRREEGRSKNRWNRRSKRRAIDEEALGSCRQIKITLKLSEHGVCLGCGFKVIKGT